MALQATDGGKDSYLRIVIAKRRVLEALWQFRMAMGDTRLSSTISNKKKLTSYACEFFLIENKKLHDILVE